MKLFRLRKQGKDIIDIENNITDMRSKERNLPNISFAEYVRNRENNTDST